MHYIVCLLSILSVYIAAAAHTSDDTIKAQYPRDWHDIQRCLLRQEEQSAYGDAAQYIRQEQRFITHPPGYIRCMKLLYWTYGIFSHHKPEVNLQRQHIREKMRSIDRLEDYKAYFEYHASILQAAHQYQYLKADQQHTLYTLKIEYDQAHTYITRDQKRIAQKPLDTWTE